MRVLTISIGLATVAAIAPLATPAAVLRSRLGLSFAPIADFTGA
jgi:hypothetical protein